MLEGQRCLYEGKVYKYIKVEKEYDFDRLSGVRHFLQSRY